MMRLSIFQGLKIFMRPMMGSWMPFTRKSDGRMRSWSSWGSRYSWEGIMGWGGGMAMLWWWVGGGGGGIMECPLEMLLETGGLGVCM